MTVTSRPARGPVHAAKLRLAASSGAPVACGYERSLRPGEACFSRPGTTIDSRGDL
jgi:hypothetical protein